MSRVITFSTKFPSYHPRAGEPTYFVEKLWSGMQSFDYKDRLHEVSAANYRDVLGKNWDGYDEMVTRVRAGLTTPFTPKRHTIRAGHRWKVGDCFSPRVWSGKPYRSPMITIAPDIQVKKVWDFTVKEYEDDKYDDVWYIDFGRYSIPDAMPFTYSIMPMVAKNDGLSLEDFLSWFKFPQPFSGQIICWDESVDY